MIVEITPLADKDLNNIRDHIRLDFSTDNSAKIMGAIYDDLEKLSIFPNMGVDILSKYGIQSDYLCLITHKNYAFYRIEGDSVKIIRVIDERRDFLKALFSRSTM